jgi:NAD(P)-dependent dehydrogenase (short-subunit alcohol dehydrogenase family)
MGQVDGKVAIVTGAASGIGAACAATLAREGAKIVVTDLDDAGGRVVAERIGGAGGEAIYLHQDVSVEEGWLAIIITSTASSTRGPCRCRSRIRGCGSRV